jgi:hypothetical protein
MLLYEQRGPPISRWPSCPVPWSTEASQAEASQTSACLAEPWRAMVQQSMLAFHGSLPARALYSTNGLDACQTAHLRALDRVSAGLFIRLDTPCASFRPLDLVHIRPVDLHTALLQPAQGRRDMPAGLAQDRQHNVLLRWRGRWGRRGVHRHSEPYASPETPHQQPQLVQAKLGAEQVERRRDARQGPAPGQGRRRWSPRCSSR